MLFSIILHTFRAMKKKIADGNIREHDSFLYFLKKVHEKMLLLFIHDIPNGKQPSELTRDLLYELFKIYSMGSLEVMSKEPLIQPVVTQPELFVSDKVAEKTDGTIVEEKKV